MDSDLVDRIAAQLLTPYWKERLKGSPAELDVAFADVHLHGVKLHPAAPIDPNALAAPLREQLGERVSINVDAKQRIANVRIEPVTGDTGKQDLAAVKDLTKQLGTHAEIRRVHLTDPTAAIPAAPETAAANPYRANDNDRFALRVDLEIPLQNLLLFGATELPLKPVIHGNVAAYPHAVRFDEQKCHHCGALHVIAYGKKLHPQDRDDIDFACLACGRVKLVAWGIPELSSYHIDLADRLPPALKTAYAQVKAARARGPSTPIGRSSTPLRWILDHKKHFIVASAVIPALILLVAWLSGDAFENPVLRGARSLATFFCVVYALSSAAWLRSGGRAAGAIANISFAATCAALIPVVVGLAQ